MRGASGTLGFDQVKQKAGDIEKLARDEDVEGILSKADGIIWFLDEVTVRFE